MTRAERSGRPHSRIAYKGRPLLAAPMQSRQPVVLDEPHRGALQSYEQGQGLRLDGSPTYDLDGMRPLNSEVEPLAA
jgi:hypothetical protein